MRKFGKYSTGKSVVFNPIPTNEEEAQQHGNALAYGKDSNYPVGTSNCFNVGISGGCGPDCFVYQCGECEEAMEMVYAIMNGKYPDHSLADHYKIYDKNGMSLE